MGNWVVVEEKHSVHNIKNVSPLFTTEDFQGWPKFRHAAVGMVGSGRHQQWRPTSAQKTIGDHSSINSSETWHFLLGDGIYKRAPWGILKRFSCFLWVFIARRIYLVPKIRCQLIILMHGFTHLCVWTYVQYRFLYILKEEQTEPADHVVRSPA